MSGVPVGGRVASFRGCMSVIVRGLGPSMPPYGPGAVCPDQPHCGPADFVLPFAAALPPRIVPPGA